MKQFRVLRGTNVNGKPFAVGRTYKAATAREAVKQDETHTREEFARTQGGTYGGVFAVSSVKPHPIVSVYELTPVPEADWR